MFICLGNLHIMCAICILAKSLQFKFKLLPGRGVKPTEISILIFHFLKPNSRGMSSQTCPSGKFANNYQVLIGRKASEWMKHHKLWLAAQEQREKTKPEKKIFFNLLLSFRLNSVNNNNNEI